MINKRRRILKFRSCEESGYSNIEALENNQIFFSSFEQLNDPYEAQAFIDRKQVTDNLRLEYLKTRVEPSTPNRTVEDDIKSEYLSAIRDGDLPVFLNNIDSIAINELYRWIEDYKETLTVFSASLINNNSDMFAYPLPSMMMWSHYAQGFTGFCLEFDFHELKESLVLANSVVITNTPVKYNKRSLPKVRLDEYMKDVLNDTNLCEQDMMAVPCTKSKAWEYEQELRLFSNSKGLHEYSPESLKCIYLSYKIDSESRSRIKEYLKDKPWIELKIVHLHPEYYGLGFFSLEDAKKHFNFVL